jgi:hypothetical protein
VRIPTNVTDQSAQRFDFRVEVFSAAHFKRPLWRHQGQQPTFANDSDLHHTEMQQTHAGGFKLKSGNPPVFSWIYPEVSDAGFVFWLSGRAHS